MAELKEMLLHLPQELYDQILDFIVTIHGSMVYIDIAYKPPSTLQMNRSTRAKAALAYYKHSTFRTTPRRGKRWIQSLVEKHRELLSAVRYSCEPPEIQPTLVERLEYKHDEEYTNPEPFFHGALSALSLESRD